MSFARRHRRYQITAAVLFALIAGAVIALTLARDAQGATITVINTNDMGAGSLRAQIAAAAPGDTIDFDPGLVGATITLTSGELVISKNLTISGPAAGITVNGNNSSRVFNVSGLATVSISHLTVSGGNTTSIGGGIYNGSGTVNLTNSTVSGNSAPTYSGGDGGGGIYNGSGAVTLANSTVSGNTAAYTGAGIYNQSGALTLTNSTVSGNTGGNGDGGGIYSQGGTVNLTDSTVSGNSAFDGGGIVNFGALTLTNSTFSGNTATNVGGGIYNQGQGGATLANSTVSGNSAVAGGGIFNYLGGTGTLTNSIVAKQLSGGDCSGGTFTSAGYNLDSDNSCNLTKTSDLPSTNPMLDPLALNPPGATETHALQPGSPAIDRIPAGVNGCGTTVATDQRGVARPQGSGCDIGAYELIYVITPTPSPTPSPTSSPTPTPTPTPTVSPTPTLTATPTATPIGQTQSPTSTPSPTPTATPIGQTQSPTPTPGVTATPTPVGTSRIWGDGDCSGAVAPRDGQADLNHFLGQAELSQTSPCPALGDTVTINGLSYTWGDWDCSGAVAPRDGQADLNHFLGLTELSQTQPCPDVGNIVQVVG